MSSDSHPAKREFNPLKVALYSSLGQWVADMVMYPLDTISTKIKAYTHKFLTFNEGYKMIVNKNGVRGLFSGFSTTFPCSFVPQVIYFVAYEYMNKFGMQKIKELDNSTVATSLKLMMPLLTSSIAEIICLVPYMPFDVVRTRLQTNDDIYQYSSVRQGIRDVVQSEGLVRLYKASHIYIATTTLQTGFLFWFYELQRYYLLHNHHSTHHSNASGSAAGEQPKDIHKLTIMQSIFVSLTSSLLSTFLVNPLDLILTRYQVTDSTKQKLSVRTITKDLIKHEGYIAFFKGLTPRLAISCANSILYLPVYEHFKALYGADLTEDD